MRGGDDAAAAAAEEAAVTTPQSAQTASSRAGQDVYSFSEAMVNASLGRSVPLRLSEEWRPTGSVRATPFYAGHVLGAAVSHLEFDNGSSVVYTGRSRRQTKFGAALRNHRGGLWLVCV